MLILALVLILLLVPMVICNALSSMTSRILTVFFSTGTFLAILSALGRASSTEMFLAGAT